MSRHQDDRFSSGLRQRALLASPSRLQRVLLSGVLLVLLLAQMFGNGIFGSSPVFAASKPVPATAHLTLQQFLREGQPNPLYRQPFTFPKTPPPVHLAKGEHLADLQHLPPGAEPPTMKPLQITLSSAFLTGSSPAPTTSPTPTATPTGTPSASGTLDLLSSDQRLEVQIVPASFDLSQARTTQGTPLPAGSSLILTISQVHGTFVGQVDVLGQYTVQITDAHGNTVQGIRLRQPISILFHYDPQVIADLGLDPGRLLLAWPQQIAATHAAQQPWNAYAILMHNESKTHTLSAQSSVLVNGTLLTATGSPDNASPPRPNLASAQGNSGQLSYAYPLTVAPGPSGTVPPLVLSYSSATTNGRHNHASPASDFGEGWSLSLGAISASEYPSNSAGGAATWYSLSGVDGISDLLVPTPNSNPVSYITEHGSQLKIVQSSANGQPCFQVWDTSGDEYLFGCTSDSLQYYTDSSGTRHNYEWDLEKIIPANEGPGTDGRYLSVSYEQDKASSNGYTTVRDAVIKQITYGDGTTLSGTVDFSYKGPYNDGSWVTKYSSSDGLRSDDPVNDSGGLNAPLVMSTFTPVSVTSYVGSDSGGQKDYRYSFSFSDSSYASCWDDYTQLPMYCAGEHLLQSVTPTVYQNGTGHQLPGLAVGYSAKFEDSYYDSTQTLPSNASLHYNVATYWQYLNSYDDLATGVGATISYGQAFNNTHGTPASNGDNRYDPLYCPTYGGCDSSPYNHPDDQAWSEQVVTQITARGTDSSSSGLAQATTTYHYRLTKIGTGCPSDGSTSDCVGDSWIPPTDNDFLDFYHTEFRGFGEVDILSPAGDLTVQHYAATDGPDTPEGNAHNYTSGSLEDEESYQGSSTGGPLLLETDNLYAGYNDWNNTGTHNACHGSYPLTYVPCEVMVTSSRTYQDEGGSLGSGPMVQRDYTYDDYTPTNGLGSYGCPLGNGQNDGSHYNNLCQENTTGTNLPNDPNPFVSQVWTYQPTDTTVSGWVYYNVKLAAHSELDDSSGTIYDCQSFKYDQNRNSGVPTPAAGFLTTVNWYQQSACTPANFGTPQISTYAGYDLDGNQLMSVDGVGTAHASFYGSGGISGKNGCTLSSAPAIYPQANWTAGASTTCTTYDSKSTLPTSTTNAFGQTSSTGYDNTQGDLPISTTDANGQTTQLTYSYDSNGNLTVQTSEPGDAPPNYTTQSEHISTCTTSSSLPCFEIDSASSLYPGAVTQSFYDALGRQVETRSPGPDDGYDTIVYTVYNDAAHSVFQSEPFEVKAGSGWLDPNGATDKNGHTVYGAVTFYDALNRVIATQDLLFDAGSSSGINCNPLGARATTCVIYKLDNVSSLSSDNSTYETTRSIDANNHVSESLSDVLGHVRYVETYSGTQGNSPTVNSLTATQYNVLGEPTSVTVTDESPHNTQSVTSISTTMQYDNLGRLIKVFDPDRGTHTYTYNADNQLTSDTSSGRTIGYNYDLLGRLGCEQSGSATIDADGSCSSGTQPLVQNTYDSNILGTQGSDDFPVGRLTKSVATTYYPEGTTLSTTQKWQYDARGRVITTQLKFSLPASWNVTNALPTYQETLTYTDADQVETTTTSILNQSGQGYSFSQVYDQTLGLLTGLSTGSTTSANLASLNYNVNDLLSKIYYQTSSGSNLATAQLTYDGDLRPQEESYSWQGGSGQSGQFFDQARSYDAASNVTGASTTIGAYSESANYCYDEQNRLVWAGNAGTQPGAGSGTCGSLTLSNSFPGASYSNTFSYTNLGQLWHAPLNGSGGSQQYLYCSGNSHQLQGVYPTGASCSNPGTATYSAGYDAWGNLTSRTYNNQTATLSYDPLDQLVEWQVPGTSQAWYGYDSSGQRSLQRSVVGSTTSLSVYAFGLEEYHYNGSGNLQSSTHYYTLAGRLLGELQVNGSTQTTNYFLSDGLGSLLGVFSNTASSASLLASQLYAPYGASRYGSGTVSPYTTKGFTGQYNDPTTGLDYYGARYYDPVVGLFVSADKKLGDMQGANPYEYVGNNPETRTDPTGEMYAPPPVSEGNLPPSNNPPASTPWWQQVWNVTTKVINTALQFGNTITNLQLQLADFVFGFSSMGNDLRTLFNGNSSIGDKIWAGLNLGINAGTDIALFFGVGELIRGGELAIKGGDLALKAGEDILEHGGEEAISHIGETLLDDGKSFLGDFCSFTASTAVMTAVGKQAIGSLHVGEKVLAYNSKTQKMELQPILHVWIDHDNDLVDLTLTTVKAQHGRSVNRQSEVIHTNKKHPFFTQEKGFLSVGQIKLGMHVLRADGQWGLVTGWKVVPGTQVMYNLEVAQDHTFAVGAGEWVVHNDCGPSTLKNGLQVSLSEQGLSHSFSRHAAEWFGRLVTDADKPAWESLIRQAMNSSQIFDWDLRGRSTIAVLSRLPYYDEMRYFVVQFYADSGELATAFRPNSDQLSAMFRLLRMGR